MSDDPEVQAAIERLRQRAVFGDSVALAAAQALRDGDTSGLKAAIETADRNRAVFKSAGLEIEEQAEALALRKLLADLDSLV